MDLSEPSRLALEEALPIARRRGADIVLVHATPMPETDTAYEWVNPGIVERYREMLKEDLAKTRSVLSEIRGRHLGQGVEISTSLVSGDAERAIADAAESVDAQLMVVGSHGRSSLDRFLIGSVAERVSRFTNRDVLVARGEKAAGGYKKILVATDFSETAGRAFDAAMSLAATNAAMTILHCVEIPAPVVGFYTGELQVELEASSAKRAESLAVAARAKGISVDVEIFTGYPPSHIRELASGHDVVVMGSHGRRGVRRFLLGSVAEKTIRHAPCSVYLARAVPKQQKDEG